MFKFQIDVKFNRILQLTAPLRREAEAAVKRNAEQCRDYAKTIAAVDTGEMRDSIDAQPDGEMTYVVGPHTDHDIFVELGTSKMPAQPFMVPSTERQRPVFFDDMGRIVERAANG